MAIQPAENTPFLQIPMPGEDSDPFYDQFKQMTFVMEKIMFMRKLMVNMLVTGGGTLTWTSGSSVLNWTDDFIIPVFHWGKRILIVYGTSGTVRAQNIPNGFALYITIPTSLSADVSLNFQVGAQLAVTRHDEFVIGWNNNGTLVMRDLGEFI